jgi:hypothetical protein
MAIHVVLGFKDPGNHSSVESIYVGRDADAARQCSVDYPGANTLWLRNPNGIRKENPALSSARDEAARAAESARLAAVPAPEVSTETKLAIAQRENEKLKKQLAAASAAVAPSAVIAAPAPVEETLFAEPAPALVVESEPEPATDAPAEDPEEATRRKAALAQAEAAEAIEKSPPKKSGKK